MAASAGWGQGTPTEEDWLAAVAGGSVDGVAALAAAGTPPPTAVLAAAALDRPRILRRLLQSCSAAVFEHGVGVLGQEQRRVLRRVGIQPEDIEGLTPLAVGVRQHSAAAVQVLLERSTTLLGASQGRQLLLHFCEGADRAAGAAAVAAAGWVPGGRPFAPGSLPSWPPSAALHASAPRAREQLTLLRMLLEAGADPLQRATAPAGPGGACFLSVCHQPVLLRAAVQHVMKQLHSGQRADLSPEDSQALIQASAAAALCGA